MATNKDALYAALKLVADAAQDTVQAIQPGESTLSRLLAYKNLTGDLFALMPQIGDIPAEAKALDPAGYADLCSHFVADLAITDAHAQAIVGAGLKLLNDVVSVIVPDAEALVAAIKAPKQA